MKKLDPSPTQRASACVRLCLLTVILFGSPLAHAAVIEAWVQRYNSAADDEDYASAVVIDHGGNVVVTGTSFNP